MKTTKKARIPREAAAPSKKPAKSRSASVRRRREEVKRSNVVGGKLRKAAPPA